MIIIFLSNSSNPIETLHGGTVWKDESLSMHIIKESESSMDQSEQLLNLLKVDQDQISIENRDIDDYSILISDFQAFDLERFDPLISDSTLYKSLFVTGSIDSYKNVFIDSLSINLNPNDFSQLRIRAFENHSSSMTDEDIVYRLYHNGRQLSSLVKNIAGNNELVFDIPSNIYGDFQIGINGDEVYYDNEFVFVIPERKKPIVTIVDEDDNLFINQVLSNSNLFSVQKMMFDAMDFGSLDNSDVILFNGISSIPSGVISRIIGKTIIIFPNSKISKEINIDWMNLSVIASDDTARYQFNLMASNPVLSGVLSKDNNFNSLPYSRGVYRVNGDFETIISLRNGTPLLLKVTSKNHFFFNTPIDLEFTNFPTHSIFLPILYKLVQSSVEYDTKGYYYPGELGYIQSEFSESPPKIYNNELEVIPEFSPQNAGTSFLVPTLESGVYWIQHNQDTFQIAINVPKEESYMEGLTLEEMKENFGHLKHITIQSARAQTVVDNKNKIALWKYALILIVFLLIIESLFHRYLK